MEQEKHQRMQTHDVVALQRLAAMSSVEIEVALTPCLCRTGRSRRRGVHWTGTVLTLFLLFFQSAGVRAPGTARTQGVPVLLVRRLLAGIIEGAQAGVDLPGARVVICQELSAWLDEF